MFNGDPWPTAARRWFRQDLYLEALRLGRIVAASALAEKARVHALVALIALQAARFPARVDALGDLVPLESGSPPVGCAADRHRVPALRSLHRRRPRVAVSRPGGDPHHVHARRLHDASTGGSSFICTISSWHPSIANRRTEPQPSPSPVFAAPGGPRGADPLDHDPALRSFRPCSCRRGQLLVDVGAAPKREPIRSGGLPAVLRPGAALPRTQAQVVLDVHPYSRRLLLDDCSTHCRRRWSASGPARPSVVEAPRPDDALLDAAERHQQSNDGARRPRLIYSMTT